MEPPAIKTFRADEDAMLYAWDVTASAAMWPRTMTLSSQPFGLTPPVKKGIEVVRPVMIPFTAEPVTVTVAVVDSAVPRTWMFGPVRVIVPAQITSRVTPEEAFPVTVTFPNAPLISALVSAPEMVIAPVAAPDWPATGRQNVICPFVVKFQTGWPDPDVSNPSVVRPPTKVKSPPVT